MMYFRYLLQFIGKKLCQPAYLLPMVLLFSQQLAHADVWGYVDDKGVAHFAAERVDARYELFFKGGESFDTQQGIPSKNAANGAANGVSSAHSSPETAASLAAKDKVNSKIQAYFDVSPSFKSVRHHMRDAAKNNRVDFELLQALIVAESGFDPQAVSPKGAVGLMQLMPDTAKRFGVRADKVKTVEQKLTDPKTNINAGTKYLRTLITMFPGKLELAIASYNAGEGAVQKYGNKIPPYKETQNYVKTVMQTYQALKPTVAIAELRNATSISVSGSAPTRVRMQIGGAIGRGNMIGPLTTSAAPTAPTAPLAATDSTTLQN
jgi:soluble lytic murein transglycosylase-like protein